MATVLVSIPLVVGNSGSVVGAVYRRPDGRQIEAISPLYDDLTEDEYVAGGRRVDVLVELDLDKIFAKPEGVEVVSQHARG